MKQWKAPYRTEVELCAAFAECAKAAGWTVYPETCEWDLLLVGPEGVQIGVQAKLRFNATLLRQALPEHINDLDRPAPDYRAILLPSGDQEIRAVCSAIGLIYFHGEPRRFGDFGKDEAVVFHGLDFLERRYSDLAHRNWNPLERHPLPEYIPDVAGGASAPVRLTEWKVCALRVCAEIEISGEITTKKIREIGCDPRRWTASGWIVPGSKRGLWKAGDLLRFPKQHPTVYQQILAETRTGDTVEHDLEQPPEIA